MLMLALMLTLMLMLTLLQPSVFKRLFNSLTLILIILTLTQALIGGSPVK